MEQSKKCPLHKKTLEYYCLDSNCESSEILCIICLKQKHINCEKNLILSKNDLKKVKIIDKNIDFKKKSEKIFKEIENYFEENTEGIFADLKFFLNKKIDNVKYFKEDLQNFNKIKELKKNYDIEKKEKIFVFFSRIMNENLNLDKSFRFLKNSLTNLFSKCFEKLEKLEMILNKRKISTLDFVLKNNVNFFYEKSKFILIPENVLKETEIFLDVGKSSFFYKIEIFRKSEISENDKRQKIKFGICKENNIQKVFEFPKTEKNQKNPINKQKQKKCENWKIKTFTSKDIFYSNLSFFGTNSFVIFSKKQNLDKNVKNQVYYLNFLLEKNTFFIYDANFDVIFKGMFLDNMQVYPFFSFLSDDYYVVISQDI